jgi:hypothetical protein
MEVESKCLGFDKIAFSAKIMFGAQEIVRQIGLLDDDILAIPRSMLSEKAGIASYKLSTDLGRVCRCRDVGLIVRLGAGLVCSTTLSLPSLGLCSRENLGSHHRSRPIDNSQLYRGRSVEVFARNVGQACCGNLLAGDISTSLRSLVAGKAESAS